MSSSTPQRTPAGWYPDPKHPRQPWTDPARIPQRYHDGTQWTEQIRLPEPSAPTDPGQYNGELGPILIPAGIAAAILILAIATAPLWLR